MLQVPSRRTAINNGKKYCCFVSRMQREFIKYRRKTKIAKGTKLLLPMDKKWSLFLSCTVVCFSLALEERPVCSIPCELLPFFLSFTRYNKQVCFRGTVLPVFKTGREHSNRSNFDYFFHTPKLCYECHATPLRAFVCVNRLKTGSF